MCPTAPLGGLLGCISNLICHVILNLPRANRQQHPTKVIKALYRLTRSDHSRWKNIELNSLMTPQAD